MNNICRMNLKELVDINEKMTYPLYKMMLQRKEGKEITEKEIKNVVQNLDTLFPKDSILYDKIDYEIEVLNLNTLLKELDKVVTNQINQFYQKHKEKFLKDGTEYLKYGAQYPMKYAKEFNIFYIEANLEKTLSKNYFKIKKYLKKWMKDIKWDIPNLEFLSELCQKFNTNWFYNNVMYKDKNLIDYYAQFPSLRHLIIATRSIEKNIVLESLENELVPKKIQENSKLFQEYNQTKELLWKYFHLIQEYSVVEGKVSIHWDMKKIIREALRGNSDKLFTNLHIKIKKPTVTEEFETSIYSNIVEIKHTFRNGRIEDFHLKNNIRQGKSILKYENEEVEERNYQNGILLGEAIVSKKGKKKKYIYEEGKRKDCPMLKRYLDFDKERINTDSYDENILCDPNRGFWKIQGENYNEEELKDILGGNVYFRDPKLDIKNGGVVGIDFGTKSTVVVFQEKNEKIFPMRISGTSLNQEIRKEDYENPTIIELKDIESFLKDYRARKGRPSTKWKDVTVSHYAFESLMNGSSDQFYSIISDIKQWAGSKKEKIIVRDKKGYEILLPVYLNLKEGELDPIELYAYYIGSYINNMRNGIYMEYFLSFPVTYEREIREHILKSFERGIRKSLPESILEDEPLMKKFKVRHGANEPAAYAICALQEYGFDEVLEENTEATIHYGIFDFGGGTTDFDFGTWKIADDERSYDYELQHFGAGGLRYLGGENILKELAFEVFKKNQHALMANKISFSRPEWCEHFLGDELLVNSSQEAKLNTKQLTEILRSIWENSDEKIGEKIKVNLYNREGNIKIGFDLDVNLLELKNIIEEKIKEGIDNFFIALEDAFKNEEREKVYIFLAGNSSKHPFVKEYFDKKVSEKSIDAEIFPPLGTKAAEEKLLKQKIDSSNESRQEDKEIEKDGLDKPKPTGKTGVAYGLLYSRSGGRIKIIDRDREANVIDEINFKYYVGYQSRKKFKVVLSPDTDYESYQYLCNATADVFDIYYTTTPEALTNKMPIDRVLRQRIDLEEEFDDSHKIYIKSVAANKIHYVITKDILDKNFIKEGDITFE